MTTMRYGVGWTDPKSVYGSMNAPFGFVDPNPALLHEIESLGEELLHSLWLLRFPEDPTGSDLQQDPFYYALAYKWYNETRLEALQCGLETRYALVPG